MKRGVPPTALKARTGELTPPGTTFVARANRASLAGASKGKVMGPSCRPPGGAAAPVRDAAVTGCHVARHVT
jgi:hypothetical protein